jgi:ADP-ribose pyrophosphatase YjhB (NUDIX family)
MPRYRRGVERTRVECVGGVVIDDQGRFLLIRRGHEPDKGCWSIPGGRVEPGETDAEATAREVLEETGLRVRVDLLTGAIEREGPDGSVYAIRDYLCRLAKDTDPDDVRHGDDADDAGWFTPTQMRALDCSPGLLDALVGWGLPI